MSRVLVCALALPVCSSGVAPAGRSSSGYRALSLGRAAGYTDNRATRSPPDGTLLDSEHVTVDRAQLAKVSLRTQGGVGGTVPATLALSLTGPASFGTFTPGVAHDYTAHRNVARTSEVARTEGRKPLPSGA